MKASALPSAMKVVGYKKPGPIQAKTALEDASLPTPKPMGRDLLVRVKAVSVNPVDAKIRTRKTPEKGTLGVLGYDVSGVVEGLGPNATQFKLGDEVFYSGTLNRPGANSEFHLVDERIVGPKPSSLSHAEAAALPLTSLTAWEMLFDRLDVRRPPPDGGKTILVIGGAGGVGSITLQLLRALTDLKIVATASRPETKKWAEGCGAHEVIDHSQPLAKQWEKLKLGSPGFVFSTTQTDRHLDDIVKIIAPQGRFGLIDDPTHLNIRLLKPKAVSIHWEFMFARPMFETPDMSEQGKILKEISSLIERGQIKSTLTQVWGKITAENLRSAHAQIESGSTKGKLVLEGFPA